MVHTLRFTMALYTSIPSRLYNINCMQPHACIFWFPYYFCFCHKSCARDVFQRKGVFSFFRFDLISVLFFAFDIVGRRARKNSPGIYDGRTRLADVNVRFFHISIVQFQIFLSKDGVVGGLAFLHQVFMHVAYFHPPMHITQLLCTDNTTWVFFQISQGRNFNPNGCRVSQNPKTNDCKQNQAQHIRTPTLPFGPWAVSVYIHMFFFAPCHHVWITIRPYIYWLAST